MCEAEIEQRLGRLQSCKNRADDGRREPLRQLALDAHERHAHAAHHQHVGAILVDAAAACCHDAIPRFIATARQIHLQRLLGYPTPRYLHVPVATNAAGEKLSKQTGAEPVDAARRGETLRRAFAFLGQTPTDDLAEGLRGWDAKRIPSRRASQ